MDIPCLVILAIALLRTGRLGPSTLLSLLAEFRPKIHPQSSTPPVRGGRERFRKTHGFVTAPGHLAADVSGVWGAMPTLVTLEDVAAPSDFLSPTIPRQRPLAWHLDFERSFGKAGAKCSSMGSGGFTIGLTRVGPGDKQRAIRVIWRKSATGVT